MQIESRGRQIQIRAEDQGQGRWAGNTNTPLRICSVTCHLVFIFEMANISHFIHANT